MKDSKQYFVILAIIVILASATLFLTGFFGNSLPGTGDVDEKMKDISILETMISDPNTETAELVAIDGSNSSGVAYRLLFDGLKHVVMAQMPDPADGSVYEGWLVQPEPLQFFSTGVMRKNSDGYWVIIYDNNNPFKSYSKVIITEETIVDEKPERHVIEGDFNE